MKVTITSDGDDGGTLEFTVRPREVTLDKFYPSFSGKRNPQVLVLTRRAVAELHQVLGAALEMWELHR